TRPAGRCCCCTRRAISSSARRRGGFIFRARSSRGRSERRGRRRAAAAGGRARPRRRLLRRGRISRRRRRRCVWRRRRGRRCARLEWRADGLGTSPTFMRITVKIKDGPQAGKQTELAPSARLRVGRGGASDWAIAEDGYLSNPHFEVVCEEGAWVLRDLDSANGTFLAGRRVTRMPVEGACEIVAGRTTFLLAPEVNVLAMLERSQPLFAILDAARTPRVLELLAGAVERFECLYSGESAVHLAACAPYLVELPRKSRLLRKLVREGWGQSWGVFFV